jgi:hypothetical protein
LYLQPGQPLLGVLNLGQAGVARGFAPQASHEGSEVPFDHFAKHTTSDTTETRRSGWLFGIIWPLFSARRENKASRLSRPRLPLRICTARPTE